MRVLSIASPVLKCVLPGGPPIDPRFQQDVFGSSLHVRRSAAALAAGVRGRGTSGRQDHPRLLLLANDGAGAVFRQHRHGAARARGSGLGARDRDWAGERARLQRGHRRGGRAPARRDRPPGAGADLGPGERLHSRRDPVSARVREPAVRAHRARARERLPPCGITSRRGDPWARWTSTGRARLPRSSATGTRGSISLETHWRGTDGDRLQASIICGKNLRKLAGRGS